MFQIKLMWAIGKGCLAAVEYTSANNNQNTQSIWIAVSSEHASPRKRNLHPTQKVPQIM